MLAGAVDRAFRRERGARLAGAVRLKPRPIAPMAAEAGPSLPELEPVLARVRDWTADEHVALIVTGGHARGDAVRARLDGRDLWLSDLDLWAVMPDRDRRDRAAARRRRDTTLVGSAGARAALGFAAAIEVGFVVPADLSQMVARPGTLELRRSGKVVSGDARVLELVPPFEPSDISLEERRLLLENRGFELLWARPRLSAPRRTALAARHALLKAVADLASVRSLASGLLPASPLERVAWARAQRPPELRAGRIDLPAADWLRLWDAVESWRRGTPESLAPPRAVEEWRRAVRAWCETWERFAWPDATGTDPWRDVLLSARRAPLRRRVRQGLAAPLPGLGPRSALRAALRGTPRHRLHAAATVLLMAAARSRDVPSLPAGALRALAQLHVLPPRERRDWTNASAALFATWDTRFHDGQRSGDAA